MMRKIILTALAIAAYSHPSVAGPGNITDVKYLTLGDALRYAVQNNVRIKNARVDVALQKAKNSEITGIALPQVNAKEDFNWYPEPVKSFLPSEIIGGQPGTFTPVAFTPKFGNTISLGASQIVFDGTILVALQAKSTLISLTELGVKATETDVRYNVRRAYYSLLVAQRQFQILQETISSFRQINGELAAMYKEGFIEKIEVDRSEVQLNNLTTDSLKIGNLLELSEQLLKYNMGMPIAQKIVLQDQNVLEEIDNVGNQLETSLNYSLRTEYQQLETALKLNEYDLKRYQYKALPTLAIFGNLATTYSTNSFQEVTKPKNYVNYALVGLQLNVPIFTGFQRKYQVVQARLNIDKSRNNLELLRQSIDFETASFRSSLRNALLGVKSQERNMDLAQSVLDLSRKKYKAGVGSNLEVSQAQTELLRAQNGYFSALLDVINARNDLAKASGDLSVPGIGEMSDATGSSTPTNDAPVNNRPVDNTPTVPENPGR